MAVNRPRNSLELLKSAGILGLGSGVALTGTGSQLPEDVRDQFTAGMMGPGYPITPFSLDDPSPRGIHEPRLTEYLPGWNYPMTPGQGKLLPFSVLRALGDLVLPVRKAVEIRKQEVSVQPWDIVLRPQYHDQAGNPELDKVREALIQFFHYPDPYEELSFADWIREAEEEIDVIDALAVYLRPTVNSSGGVLGTGLGALNILDGTCFSADTEVLTNHGWKLFTEVDMDNDLFATRNNETHALEWQKSTYFYDANWNGDMYHFYTRSLDILVTPNHRMIISSLGSERTMTAEEIGKQKVDWNNSNSSSMKIPVTASWTGKKIDRFVLSNLSEKREKEYNDWKELDGPGISMYTLAERIGVNKSTIWRWRHGGSPRRSLGIDWSGDDFCAFMGMYLSEGCVTLTGTPKRGAIYITQKDYSKGWTPFLELLTRLLGRESGYDGNSWHFKNQELYEYLKPFGHAPDKFIPELILNATPEQQAIFWHYYMLGDGHIDSDGREGVSTCSKKMADGMQELALKMGYSSSVREQKQSNDCYINGRLIVQKHTQYNIKLRTSDYQGFRLEKVQYSGKVYCVSVPNESLYVRRNGFPAWTRQTIKPLRDYRGGRPQPPAPAYQQYLYGAPRTDLFAINSDEDEDVIKKFSANELIYRPFNRRSFSVYGFSNLEMAIQEVKLWIDREQYHQSYYDKSDLPAMFIQVPKEWPPNQIAEYEQSFNRRLAGDPQWRWRVKMIPTGGVQGSGSVVPVKQVQYELAFDEWLVRLIAMAFDVTAEELGLQPKGGLGGRGWAEEAGRRMIRLSLMPRLQYFAELFNVIIRRKLGVKEFVFQWLDTAQTDARDKAYADTMYVDHGIMTRGEIRENNGLDIIDGEGVNELMVTTAQGTLPLAIVANYGRVVSSSGMVDTTEEGKPDTMGSSGQIGVGGELNRPKPDGTVRTQPGAGGAATKIAREGELETWQKLLDRRGRLNRPFESHWLPGEFAEKIEMMSNWLPEGSDIREWRKNVFKYAREAVNGDYSDEELMNYPIFAKSMQEMGQIDFNSDE